MPTEWPYVLAAQGWKVTSLLLIQSPDKEYLDLALDEEDGLHETIANGGSGWLRELADTVNENQKD